MRFPRVSVPLASQLSQAPALVRRRHSGKQKAHTTHNTTHGVDLPFNRTQALASAVSPSASSPILAMPVRPPQSQRQRRDWRRRLRVYASVPELIATGSARGSHTAHRRGWRTVSTAVSTSSATAAVALPTAHEPVDAATTLAENAQHSATPGLELTDRELRRRVWSLSGPAIGEQLLALGVGVSDTFLSGHLSTYAGHILGYGQATAVAAVGAAGLITWIVLTAFFSINIGVTALVARATGAQDRSLAGRAAAQGALLGLVAGIAMLLLAAPLADVITLALGVNGQVATLAADFIRVWSLGMPAAGIGSACTAAMRGAGDTRRPVLVMLFVNGVNVVASWLLLNGASQFGLAPIGVVGSAVGAATGWVFGAILAVILLARAHPQAPRLTRPALRPDFALARRILHVGLPSALELIIFQLGVLSFNREVVALGPIPYAANTTINTVESLGTLPAVGFSVAATALVGQALGARNPGLARRATLAAMRPCIVMMVALGTIAVLAPRIMLGLFVADPTVLSAGDVAMRISLMILPASGITFVLNGALRGAGDTKFPVLTRTVGPWGLRLPLTLLLLPLLGLPGGRLAMAMDFWTQAGLAWWRFRSGRWRKARV
ncbi:MAG: MATE family efflux transporter [Ktedonobacterales bacterium]